MGYKLIDLEVKTIYGSARAVAKCCPTFGTVDGLAAVNDIRPDNGENVESVFAEVWRMFCAGELNEIFRKKD